MEPNEAKVWFYIKDRQQKGPIGFFELTKLLEHGVLNGETYLWTDGADGWQMAKAIEEFKDYSTVNSHSKLSLTAIKAPPKNRPFVRLMAKLFDLSLFTVLFSTFISIFSLDLILKTSKITLFIIYFILWNLIEPLMLSIFGTTVGYSLFNIKIKCANGELLNFFTAFKRNLFIVNPVKGVGFPFIILLFHMNPFKVLRKKTRSVGDEKAGTIVLYGPASVPGRILGTFFPLVVFLAGIIIS